MFCCKSLLFCIRFFLLFLLLWKIEGVWKLCVVHFFMHRRKDKKNKNYHQSNMMLYWGLGTMIMFFLSSSSSSEHATWFLNLLMFSPIFLSFFHFSKVIFIFHFMNQLKFRINEQFILDNWVLHGEFYEWQTILLWGKSCE